MYKVRNIFNFKYQMSKLTNMNLADNKKFKRNNHLINEFESGLLYNNIDQ